jgi:signal transduction histidine kinase
MTGAKRLSPRSLLVLVPAWMPMGFLIVSSWVGALSQAGEAGGPSEVTSFHQFYTLPRDQAMKGMPLRIRGVVLCFDHGWNQLYVHDGAETAWLSPQPFRSDLKQGQSVEITGSTTFQEGYPAYTNLQLKVLGEGTIPQPRHLTLSQMATGFGQWVEIAGRVRMAETSLGRLAVIIQDGEQHCLVYVMGQLATKDFKWLLGSRVVVRGINASKVVNGHLESASLTAAGLEELRIVEPSMIDVSQVPVMPIEALLNRELGAWTNRIVHLNGLVVSYKPEDSLVIKDPTGLMRAKVRQSTRVQVDERVDLWGFLRIPREGPLLEDAYFEVARVAAPIVAPSSNSAVPETSPVALRRVADVRALHREEASLGKPVSLRGVVTYADPEWQNGFLQDPSGAIYFELTRSNVQSGQYVELRGQTAPGGFAPQVVNANIDILGSTNFPPATKVDLEDLAGGHFDAHWVEMEGVVRQATREWGHILLRLVTRKGTFRVILPPSTDTAALPENLVDALVSVQGACAAELNFRRQLSGITLHVPGLDHIKILEAVSADPLGISATRIDEVATFDPDKLAGRRIKITGVVTLTLPGQGCYLQDSTGSIRVSDPKLGGLRRGDIVEVLGFPTMGEFSPGLEQALFRVTGSQLLPKPREVTAEQVLLHGTNDGMVVAMEAYLLQGVSRSAHPKLTLQQGSIIFTAHLTIQSAGQELEKLVPGSLVRLTGVCAIQGSERHEPESFKLLLSGPAAVKLVRAPPWWTLRHTLMLVGGMTLGVLAAWIWIGSLRRQVRAQTELIRQNHRKLLETSRQAGMAEVATTVLHNVGNVLNSVNVSGHLIAEQVQRSKAMDLVQVERLMREHAKDLGDFIIHDPQGRQLPAYLKHLTQYLAQEQETLLAEVNCLLQNIGHIKDIVAVQQSYAKVGGVLESVNASDLVEDALRMNQSALDRHDISVERTYDPRENIEITVDKHKVLQILVNLIQNAKHACSESGRPDKRLILTLSQSNGRVRISITDNGVGIPPENLDRIFNHGFTTRRNGHGFGLHSGALAAKDMGGALVVSSRGVGQGATFTLELPRNTEHS